MQPYLGAEHKAVDIMSMKSKSYRKPNLLVVLTLFVGVSFFATAVAQAGETHNLLSLKSNSLQIEKFDSWVQSLWSLDLAKKLKNWQPKITPADDGEGVQLARPLNTFAVIRQ